MKPDMRDDAVIEFLPNHVSTFLNLYCKYWLLKRPRYDEKDETLLTDNHHGRGKLNWAQKLGHELLKGQRKGKSRSQLITIPCL